MSSRLNKVDAVNFVDNIKLQFEGDPSRYNEFITIMKAYKKSRYFLFSPIFFTTHSILYRIDDSEVVTMICELLVGYPTLVKEFNAFLPAGYFLEPSDREEGEAYITVNRPEGPVTVYPQDKTRTQLVSGPTSSPSQTL